MQYPIIDNLIYAYQRNGWTGLDIQYSNNLLPFPYYESSNISKNGVTLEYDDIGACHISGTNYPDSTTYFTLFNYNGIPSWLIPGETYTVRPPIQYEKYFCQLILYGTPSLTIDGGRSVRLPNDLSVYNRVSFVIGIYRNAVVNEDVLPAIYKGNAPSEWEPYELPTTDIANRLKLPLPHYFPHPVIDALISASTGQQTEEQNEILRHYLTPLGIGGI